MTTPRTVAVTGASGYIATHIIEQLLNEGYRVRGTVRRTPSAYPWLTALKGAAERLELFSADLLEEGSFERALSGCDALLHTASPYVINVNDPERDLLAPALEGTRNVLSACRRAGTIRRVVLTSSIAAVTDEPDSRHTFTEADWNSLSSLERNPYHYAKTMAERAAWEFMEHEKPGFSLVALNPTLVTGPSLSPGVNTTNGILRDILTGVYPGIMDMNWGFVDVRDTAAAHILAMNAPEARGRYLCSSGELTMHEVVRLLRQNGYSGYRLPKIDLSSKTGTALMKMLSYTQPKDTGTFIRTHIGRAIHISNEKIRRDLNMTFMPPEKSILDAVGDMINQGHLPDKRS
ncbi:MAG: epimerase [Pelodictyon luteolum]|uniref:Epimerase n=1 Tax=Pelodictyon luteolum TaxID=1100 RepID=A0A165MDF8_PELLU|nr:aldehyde reductase [Pelodictyon luteolum]KZK75114.1 MAG: epimerase [Pelodictyon luteolum]